MKAGADVNKVNEVCKTHMGNLGNYLGLTSHLLKNGETAVAVAASSKVDPQFMELLLRAGGDVNKPTKVRQ